jgi:YbgC/YbaW family acyl-CoA thioester hydrolase
MTLKIQHQVTVEWGDCDPAGIVYYPAYFRWSDQATYRLFLAAGLKRDDLSSGQWTEGTPLVAAECAFRIPSQQGEKLVVESHVSRFGRSSFTVTHVIRNEAGDIAAEGSETRIWARKEGDARSLKAVPIPEDVKKKLGG